MDKNRSYDVRKGYCDQAISHRQNNDLFHDLSTTNSRGWTGSSFISWSILLHGAIIGLAREKAEWIFMSSVINLYHLTANMRLLQMRYKIHVIPRESHCPHFIIGSKGNVYREVEKMNESGTSSNVMRGDEDNKRLCVRMRYSRKCGRFL